MLVPENTLGDIPGVAGLFVMLEEEGVGQKKTWRQLGFFCN